MQIFLGYILILFPGLLYSFQVISSINFSLAQRLGLQENPQAADPLLQRAEQYTAYWDLVTLIWLPFAGVLMIIDHPWWSLIALIGASIYIDSAGREAAKILSFRHHGLKTGTKLEQKTFLATYIIMALLGIITVFYSLQSLTGTN